MKAYIVTTNDEDRPEYVGTFAEAKEAVKISFADGHAYYADVSVQEVDVQTDKAGIIYALNRAPVLKYGRKWIGTSRGGLREKK